MRFIIVNVTSDRYYLIPPRLIKTIITTTTIAIYSYCSYTAGQSVLSAITPVKN